MQPNRLQFKTIAYSIVICFVIIANAYILLHRNEGYRYFPYKTYSELYITDSTQYLKQLHIKDDSIQIILSLPITSTVSYKIDNLTCNPSLVKLRGGNILTFKLNEGVHTYKITCDNALPIEITVDHSRFPDDSTYVNEFIYCNLSGPNIKVAQLADYKTGISLFNQLEVDKAKYILQTRTKFYKAINDSTRVMELCKFVAGLQSNPKGCHFQKLAMLPPAQQLDSALMGRGYLVCGNYTSILLYLASVTNLPNRGISFTGSIDTWQYAAHYMTEFYLRDKQEWVVVDAVNNIYLPQDSSGHFYNVADIRKMIQTNGTKGKLAYTFINNKATLIAYDSINTKHYYYNRNNAGLLYAKPSASLHTGIIYALIDFYLFDNQFAIYSDTHCNDWSKIILKEVLLLLMLILLIYLVYFIIFKTK